MADELMGTSGTPDEKVQAGIEAQAASDAQLSALAPDAAPAEPVPTTKEAAATALAIFYRWHDTDTRWTSKLDAIKAYIVELEAGQAPAATDEALTPGVGVAASQPGKKSKK